MIRESSGALGGVTYSSNVYAAKVSVTQDAHTGVLSLIGPVYYNVANSSGTLALGSELTSSTTPNFINIYIDDTASITLNATKILTGNTLNENEFDFTLTAIDQNGNKLSADDEGYFKETITNRASKDELHPVCFSVYHTV